MRETAAVASVNIPLSVGGNASGRDRGRGRDRDLRPRRLQVGRADCRSTQSSARCCSATAAASECEPGVRAAGPTTAANTMYPWLWYGDGSIDRYNVAKVPVALCVVLVAGVRSGAGSQISNSRFEPPKR